MPICLSKPGHQEVLSTQSCLAMGEFNLGSALGMSLVALRVSHVLISACCLESWKQLLQRADLHACEARGLHCCAQGHGIRHPVASHKTGWVAHLRKSLIYLHLMPHHYHKLQA